jgi:hypothetical protein
MDTATEEVKVHAVPLTGDAAKVATLRAKLAIARSRAQYARARVQRESEAAAAVRYADALRAMGCES